MSVSQDQILDVLRRVKDPDLNRDIVALGFVKDVKVCDATVAFTVELTTPACPVREQMKEEAHRAVMSLPGIKTVNVTMTSQVRPTPSEQKSRLLPKVKNIVPIASGKGGVGKSTVSANLAVALAQMGASVGLADMDVYGPSIPTLLGAPVKPVQRDGRLIPVSVQDVRVISMGYFIPKNEAVVWRGPMLHKTVEQFLGTVEWGELDYLIVDLPPGTGDVHLSLCQLIPLTGAAVVSTPQDVALNVAEKAILMFEKLRTPVLGLIENMSGFVCSHCGQREEIFGSGGARRYSLERKIPFLGEIPLSTDIRTASDSGIPIVTSQPDSIAAKAFTSVAKNLAAQVSIQTSGATLNGDRPLPKEINRVSPETIRIQWQDGHESLYPARHLRLACSCANCVDENTGKKRLVESSVPAGVTALAMSPVGRYAVHFQWSDGHQSGIYTFDHLRAVCPCDSCAKANLEPQISN